MMACSPESCAVKRDILEDAVELGKKRNSINEGKS